MSKILVVGNILKDVYLRLDEKAARLETDENGTRWLDLSFDSSSHELFERVAMFGGAAVTLEVLDNFGIETSIAGNKKNDFNAVNYRYILCAGNEISYFIPSKRAKTGFEEPEEEVDWIFVDRSAFLDEKTAQKILKFVNYNSVRLAIYVPKQFEQYYCDLIERADLVFTNGNLQGILPNGKVCIVGKRHLSLAGDRVYFRVEKEDLLTHLTINSIAAATILGATLQNETIRDSLLLAKENIENATLDRTLSYDKLKGLIRLDQDNRNNLRFLAKSLVACEKGILAADESGGSIHKKFESMGILDDEQHRRDYRNIFFTTKDLAKYVNGVILFDETARQLADDGRNFVKFLTMRGIIPGIKVDKGLAEMPGSQEKYTLGLDGLEKRLEEYYEMGLRFAKWRAAFEITENTPSNNAILKNCEILAEYAQKCQEAKIVPIIEPEVVYDGNYSIEKNIEVTGKVLDELFRQLEKRDVRLDEAILKVNMVLAGKKFATQSTPEEVGKATTRVLCEHVPKDLAGIVFLSGGQGVEQATKNLKAVIDNGPFPWPVTFSFARALQDPALDAWRGDNKNYEAAREAFLGRLIENCKALKTK